MSSQTFDAVLMDLYMPEMDGAETTRRIRLQTALRDLPVIGVTAALVPDERELCRSAGMNDFLAKPVNPVLLAQMLLRWVAGDRSATSAPLA